MKLYEIHEPTATAYAESINGARKSARSAALDIAANGLEPGGEVSIVIQEVETKRMARETVVAMLSGERDGWVETVRIAERFEVTVNSEGVPSVQRVVFEDVGTGEA